MNWSARVAKVRHWSRHDWRGLWQGWAALVWASWQLRRPLPDVLSTLKAQRPNRANTMLPADVVRGVQRAAHLFPRPMLCLPQSIAIARLLQQQGQSCAFMLGAQPQDDTLAAHAWIEIEGVPINSAADTSEHHPILLEHCF